MKKKLLFVLLAVAVLTLALAIGVFATGEGSSPALTVKKASLSLEENVRVNFKVSFEELTETEAANVKLLVWKGADEGVDYTQATVDTAGATVLSVVEAQTIDGVVYQCFQYKDVAAKEMGKTLYVRAYYAADAEMVVYSDTVRYSVAQYLYDMQIADAQADEDVKFNALLNSLIAYGNAAQAYFATQNDPEVGPQMAGLYNVTVEGGTLADGMTSGKFLAGESITLLGAEHFHVTANGSTTHVEGTTATVNANAAYAACTYENSACIGCGYIDATAMTAEQLNTAVAAQLAAGETDIKVTLAADAGADMFVAIRSALVETEGVEDGSIHLTLAGCTEIPEYYYSTPEESQLGVFGYKSGYEIDERVTELGSVTLPDVVTIGEYAFYYADNLTKISAPKATSVGYHAFDSCSRLTEVELPLVATVGASAFNVCEALTEISLPSATAVGNHAFTMCRNLSKVVLPSVTTIENYAFQSCEKLTEITFGSLVSVDHSNYGIFYGDVDTNNITLTLSADQKVMTKGDDNYWTACEELYSVSEDYQSKTFMDYTFKDIILAD